MTIDERIQTLVPSVELLLLESRQHSRQLQQDAENIRALVRVAEIHERRLTELEGGEQ